MNIFTVSLEQRLDKQWLLLSKSFHDSWIHLKFNYKSAPRMALLSLRSSGTSEVMNFCQMIWVIGFHSSSISWILLTSQVLHWQKMFILALLIQNEHRVKEYSSDRLQLDIQLQKKRHEKNTDWIHVSLQQAEKQPALGYLYRRWMDVQQKFNLNWNKK